MSVTAHSYRTAPGYADVLWGQIVRDSGVSAQLLARRILADVSPDVPDHALPLALCAGLRSLVRYVPERGQVVASLGRLVELGAGDCNDLAPALCALLRACGWSPALIMGWSRNPSGALYGSHLWVGVDRGATPRDWSDRRQVQAMLELDPSTYDLRPGERPSSRYEVVTVHRGPDGD